MTAPHPPVATRPPARGRVLSRAPDLPALGLLVVAAAALRFATIDVQSFWHDETLTVHLLRMPLGDMVSTLPHAELTPPLYYVVAWPWVQLFGSSEVALRTLSALSGVAVVPVAYAVGRELASRRVGLVAATLATFSPLLVWYSQEARPYSLFVLLGALSLLYFVRALRLRTNRALALWVLWSVVALLTHYFAAFVLVPQALWLAWVWRPRLPALVAGGAIGVTGLALIPLAHRELRDTPTGYIGIVPLHRRALAVPEDYLTGFVIKWDTLPEKLLDGLALALAAGAVYLVVTRADARERRGALIAGAIAIAATLLPALALAFGSDLINTRNLLLGWLPAALVLAVGLGAARTPRAVAVAGVGALCAVGVAAAVLSQANREFHRSDIRGSSEALGPALSERVLAVPVAIGPVDYGVYQRGLAPLGARGARVTELAVVTPRSARLGGRNVARPARLPPAPTGFHLVERRYADAYTLLRYRAPRPTLVTPAAATASARGVLPLASLLLQRPA